VESGRSEQRVTPMYRRLPLGPHRMTREDVARNQRTRLFGAMIEAVSEQGYKAITIGDLIGLAGVSRRAFYERFANKEECFLACHDVLVARAGKLALRAWEGERGWANRVHAAFKAMLDDCVASPKGPHLVLVDSLGVGPGTLEHMQRAATINENVLASAFDCAPDGVKLPPLAAKAIVGGIRHVLFVRLRDHRERELLTMTDELLDWISAYRSPAGGRLQAGLASGLRLVPSAKAAFLTRDDVRARTLESVVRLTRAGGYTRVTDPQIAELAGTSTEAFHKQFRSKQECFLAVLEELGHEAAETMRSSVDSASCWADAVRDAVHAFTELFTARPELIRMAFVDLFEVGPAIAGRLTCTIEGFTKVLAETGPEPSRAPQIAPEAITGAIWAILASCTAKDRLPYLPHLEDHITFIVLAPYVGPKQAMQTIEAGHQQSGPQAA
jgi:AcrR family transcriptional regulator